MSDENKEVQEVKEECKCFCRSEGVKKFVVVALGTFVGVYAALSLFAFVHRPPCPPCPYGNPFVRPPMHNGQHFDKGQFPPRGAFHRVKFDKKQFNKEIPARVDVEK